MLLQGDFLSFEGEVVSLYRVKKDGDELNRAVSGPGKVSVKYVDVLHICIELSGKDKRSRFMLDM